MCTTDRKRGTAQVPLFSCTPSDGVAAQSAATARQIWRRLQAGPDRAGTAAAAELLRPTDVSSLRRAGSRNDFRRTPQTPTQHLAAADAAGCALPVRRILAYVKIKCTPAAILTTLYRASWSLSSPSAEKERPGEGEALFFQLRPLRPPRHADELRVGCAPPPLLQTRHYTRIRPKSKGKCTPGGALAFLPSSDALRLPEGAGCAVGNRNFSEDWIYGKAKKWSGMEHRHTV